MFRMKSCGLPNYSYNIFNATLKFQNFLKLRYYFALIGNVFSKNRKGLLFLNNARRHPELWMANPLTSRLCFSQKYTSRLQWIEVGIIQNFKLKYQISLVKYVLFQINDNNSVAKIIKDVIILMASRWVQRA